MRRMNFRARRRMGTFTVQREIAWIESTYVAPAEDRAPDRVLALCSPVNDVTIDPSVPIM